MTINKTIFYPKSKEEKLRLKENYFGSSNVTTFGFIGENNMSSDLGVLLIAFSKLKIKIKEANEKADEFNALDVKPEGMEDICMPRLDMPKFLLNTNKAGVIDVINLCSSIELEIGTDLFLYELEDYGEEQENEMYNALDYFVTVSNGDKDGFNVIKAMATKTLVICPKHTVFEKIGNSINYVFKEEFVYPYDGEVLRYLSQSTEVAHVCKTMMMISPEEKKQVDAIIENAFRRIQ